MGNVPIAGPNGLHKKVVKQATSYITGFNYKGICYSFVHGRVYKLCMLLQTHAGELWEALHPNKQSVLVAQRRWEETGQHMQWMRPSAG